MDIEKRRRFIERNLSTIAGAILLFGAGLLMLPIVVKHNPLGDLVTKTGHLDSIYFRPGGVTSENTFEITFKEFNKKFVARGLSDIDQTVITHNEPTGSLFQFTVGRQAFESSDELVPLVSLSSANSVYLTDDKAGELIEQSRWLALAILLITFSLAGYLGFRMRKGYLTGKDAESTKIDSLLIGCVLNPVRAAMGVSVILFLFFGILTSHWIFALALGVLSFIGSLAWQKKFFKQSEWISSILKRHEEQVTRLAARPDTGASPKHIQAIQLLLKSGGKLDAKNAAGKAPIHITTEAGNVEAVALLLKNGAKVDLTDGAGDTALIIATRKGSLGLVMKLLEAGADINIANSNQETATGIALTLKNPAIADLLKKQAFLTKQSAEKKIALEAQEAAKEAAKKSNDG